MSVKLWWKSAGDDDDSDDDDGDDSNNDDNDDVAGDKELPQHQQRQLGQLRRSQQGVQSRS